jgi:prepilin signal peptidase PulO-like enzyme (type II secretory pathway)
MIPLFLFIFGTIIGSFLNVLGLRWNTGLNLSGRSECPNCKTTLRWYELVPILSFFFLLGRCRTCRSKLSWQYPIIEILTGLVFLTLYQVYGLGSNYLLGTFIFSIYVVILIYDSRHKIIPDILSYSATFLALIFVVLNLGSYSTLDYLAGPILFGFFASIWLISGGRAMGFGDAKLSLSIGFLLGAAMSFSAIILAFWIGAAYALTVMALGKVGFLKSQEGLTMKSEVPFAPFIILGAWMSLILGLNLLHVPLF